MGVVIIDGTTVRSFVEDEPQFNESVEKTFAAFDLNGDGTLSRSEIRTAFESMRLIDVDADGQTPAQLTALYDSIFEGFDIDHSGTVDLEEFRCEMKKIMLAIADGLGESPIQMALEGGSENLLQKAADLEASKQEGAQKSA
ncbi:hypothetical protein SOVF_031340 [Spinacia oleracea]|uniref:EF-hand domain-containing protein n=1 Tax=Spinacia oleracea TaxID=3562 RepID=A0A9R0IE00_SPIOL|nr:uncharacterized protein LOC110787166 [Spinacia oleracea]KNA22656.1 hypothetical protein SOVF_031340 [Spinacia oleracea]